MADVARTAIVSTESHKGLLVDDSIKNSPNGDSNDLTDCSASNHTNNHSTRNSCSSPSEAKDGYQEIDSFSELSFRTTDEISLQDLIESEFAARISTMNGDEINTKIPGDSSTGVNRSHDPFDDLFEEYDSKEPQMIQMSHGKDFIALVDDDVLERSSNNLDDFISSQMKGDTSLITDYQENGSSELEKVEAEYKPSSKSASAFKQDIPDDIPLITNFDPFTAIEEDSEGSNPINSNCLNSPDEFPFPESPKETKSADNSAENYENDYLFVNSPRENAVNEFFSKTVSDENLDSFVVQNCENVSAKFHVVNNMSSVESVNDSYPNVSNLTSPDKLEVDEFFSTDNILEPKIKNEVKLTEENFEDKEIKEISPPADADLFLDEETFDKLEDLLSEDSTGVSGEGDLVTKKKFLCYEEEWTTVEEALKAEPENFELEGDSSALNVTTNQCVKANNFFSSATNDITGLTQSQVNGFDETDSEAETISESSEKKTTKKKKSKKGKKSDEKENISVEPSSNRISSSAGFVSTSATEDLGDLSNVSVKNLMLTYSSEAPKSFHKNHWPNKDSQIIPIQNLKARSLVDLTSSSKKIETLRFNLFENAKNAESSRSTSNLFYPERHPVVTGVSVRALKERYCSMINLNETAFSGEITPPKRRKKMRAPWSEALKSSFRKFDQLSKKTVLHVRSVDTTKVQKQFSEASAGASEVSSNCKSCGKQVFQMEQIKAEKSLWHKNCFRCKECNKQLSVDTYQSHEGVLYCKPHFKELFKPKAVLEDETEPVKLKKPELIIKENQPVELPPEVVRASDKPDLGLEELASLNVKSRFQVFEKTEENLNEALEKSPSVVNVKRSPSILSKLAKFQKKGMNVGVKDEELNGLPIEQSSTSSEEEEEEEETQEETETSKKVVKSKKVRERPMSFSKMGDVKSVWENGVPKTREEMREERNREIHQIRSKLFMGKQVKMKEAYEQAVRESENVSPRKSVEIRSEKAKSIKECFEKGEPLVDDENEVEEKKKIVEDDLSLFEAGISKKSRSLFLELDKTAKTQQTAASVKKSSPASPNTPSNSREVSRQPSENIVRSSDTVQDVEIKTADVSSKFKFFEKYKEPEREKKPFRITPPREGQVKTESPEREIYRDPNVVRACDKVEQEIIRTNTTAKMLSLFRQMEEKTEEIPDGPKPLKRFTPPPDYKGESEGESEEEDESEEEEDEEETNSNIVRALDKVEDEYLKQAANAARAKQLRAKFEKWEEKEKEREREELLERKVNGSTTVAVENSENVEVTSIECTKSLRARFESLKSESAQPKEKVTRPKVNRFVEIQNNLAELCEVCKRRVYQLEKVETSGKIFHKSCFRCMHCNCLLRMESFTLNCGNLYCLPHFKQKFISKGNYDEGFGVDQHKAKWPTVTSF